MAQPCNPLPPPPVVVMVLYVRCMLEALCLIVSDVFDV